MTGRVTRREILAVIGITRGEAVTVVIIREVSSDPGRSGEQKSNDRDHQKNRGGVTGITKTAEEQCFLKPGQKLWTQSRQTL